MAWLGCPSEYRSETWRIILQCLPNDKERDEKYIEKRVNDYKTSQERLGCEKDVEQIDKDLNRISEDLDNVKTSMKRILSLWAAKHPASGYVQGIHDILTPFIRVYYKKENGKYVEPTVEEEANAYDSLTTVLQPVQDFYTCQQPRIYELLNLMEKLLKSN